MSFFIGLGLGALFCGMGTMAFIIRQRQKTDIEEWTDSFYRRTDIANGPRVTSRIINRKRSFEL